MKLRELMKLYGLTLEVAIVDTHGGDRVSVSLTNVRYFEHPGCINRTFPGWGSSMAGAIKDYISEMRAAAKSREMMSFTGRDGKTETIPVPMISSF